MVTFKIMGLFVPKTSKEVKNSDTVILAGHIEANGVTLLNNVKKVVKQKAETSEKECVFVIKIEPKTYTDEATGEVVYYNSITIIEQKEL